MNLIGQTVNGYKIINFINDGGFGVVYKAEKDGGHYALKLFREAYVLKEYRKKGDNRIQREIDIIKKVSHENLVDYVDNFIAEVDESPHHFLVMEYVEGRNLRKILEEKNKLSEDDALKYLLPILDGIEALHEEENGIGHGIIHRDLKPENIIITGDDKVKIVDFGISKIIDYTSLTSTGEVFGTGPYMSPEQITDSKHVDRRSDLYTIGIILYEMLTGEIPYDYQSGPELIDKIKNEPPIPPRRKIAEISNHIENIILRLLEKDPFKRFSDILKLRESLIKKRVVVAKKEYDLTPQFVLRLWNDKTVLENYMATTPSSLTVEFPINLRSDQSGLMSLVTGNDKFNVIIDPATVRLAYETYSDNKGLSELPYARDDFQPITVEYLADYKKQKEYVKNIIDLEAESGADILMAPFHYTHNSSVALTTANTAAEWFDLDIKLLKESIDYKNATESLRDKPIYAGICLHYTSINSERDRKHVLNNFTLFDCDGYFVYIDCIDKTSSRSTLFNYVNLLRDLQHSSGKPVIAGRLNAFGLGLLCAGVSAFSSGAARFESFYEDLYKEAGPAFNMYERYYYPQLLTTIPILKKDPSKFEDIAEKLGYCKCVYCKGKSVADSIAAKNTKLHFLYSMQDEVEKIKSIAPEDRIDYFLQRINDAIDNYTMLTPSVFKPSDYAHLNNWREVFQKLK